MSRLAKAKALLIAHLSGCTSDEVWAFQDTVWREWAREVSSQVLILLADGPMTTTELADQLAESRRLLKKHLDAMQAEGLVGGEQDLERQGYPKVWTLTDAGAAAAREGGVEVAPDFAAKRPQKQLALLEVPSTRPTKGQQGGVGPGGGRRRS